MIQFKHPIFHRTLVIGSLGQVGSSLMNLLPQEQAIGIDRDEVDLYQVEGIHSKLNSYSPSLVILTSAYTDVNRAEQEELNARTLNGIAPGEVAKFCKKKEIPLVHYSTDYVLPGKGDQPQDENETPHPLNAYGRTKLEGERAITQSGLKQYLILRTSWVYKETGSNFLLTMKKLGQEKEKLTVVSDEVGAPTYAPDLAQATLLAIQQAVTQDHFPSGIYHLCHQGETSWYEFAQEIFERLKQEQVPLLVKSLEPILSKDYAAPARRPLNSRLNTQKIRDTLDISLPHWRDGLKSCMAQMLANDKR